MRVSKMIFLFAICVSSLVSAPIFAAPELYGAPAPEWVKAIPPGTWAEISLNTPADVDPEDDPEANPNYPNSAPWRGSTGQNSVIQSWNGGALATRFSTHGGLVLF